LRGINPEDAVYLGKIIESQVQAAANAQLKHASACLWDDLGPPAADRTRAASTADQVGQDMPLVK